MSKMKLKLLSSDWSSMSILMLKPPNHHVKLDPVTNIANKLDMFMAAVNLEIVIAKTDNRFKNKVMI
jgi:hypothetical protein